MRTKATIISGLLAALCGGQAVAEQFIVKDWPARPRGGQGTFQARWTARVAPDPGEGTASFYSDQMTASGERLRPNATTDLTCSRPDAGELGACLIVSRGDREIRCRVNDIGPARYLNRKIDLTPAGFAQLGMRPKDGLGLVTVRRCD